MTKDWSEFPLHPINELQALGDVDAYLFIMTPVGKSRVHFVKRSGEKFIDPPPADLRCESCGRPPGSAPPYSDAELDSTLANKPPYDFGPSPDTVEVSGRPLLAKLFQRSEVDGATIAVWLCSSCAKLEPARRHLRF